MNIRELTLLTARPRAQRHFYERELGFRVIDDSVDGFTVHVGRTRLTFIGAAAGHQPRYHFALNIAENKVAEARAWLAERTDLLEVDDDPVVSFGGWNAESLYFRDPAGNIVELIARHALSTASAEPFGPGSVLEVSEIGMPVPDVPETINRLADMMDARVWDRTGERFAAVGDQRGLFILVPATHTWYPTPDPVEAHPIRVLVHGDFDGSFAIPGRPYQIIVRRG